MAPPPPAPEPSEASLRPSRLEIPARIADNETAVAEYQRLGRILLAARMLTEADENALASLALTHAELIEEESLLKAEGRILASPKTGSGYANPRCWIVRDLRDSLARAYREFGMTPAARSRMKEKPVADQGAEGFADRVVGSIEIGPTSGEAAPSVSLEEIAKQAADWTPPAFNIVKEAG